MSNITYITKGNADPYAKPRVYFTCHPEDLEQSFRKITEDIFKTHSCAIYYTPDMTGPFDETYLETDEGRMNLLVVPVTRRLLTTSNRTMEQDIPFAKNNGIPILPIMMEMGADLDALYARPDKFGQLQYLYPFSTDMTQIPYAEKLKKYLDTVLISEEMIKRIKDAFDIHIFLSYRKKDRHYAQRLMRLIHKDPQLRDVAIWYDEFLKPSESFMEGIQKALQDSQLFALLVTPSLLEYHPDGTPNFVMAQEYPAATTAGKPILPVEMELTDRTALADRYPGIPNCIDPVDEALLKQQLLQLIPQIVTGAGKQEPEHLFLVGLAYMEGIDMEVDRSRGVEMITAAAEAGLSEAMQRLVDMYSEGAGVELDYHAAARWAARLIDYYTTHYGPEDSNTINAMNNLGIQHMQLGAFSDALHWFERSYQMARQSLGRSHPQTLKILVNLSCAYAGVDQQEKALELNLQARQDHESIWGADGALYRWILSHLAAKYSDLGRYTEAIELEERIYAQLCKEKGEEDPDTLWILSNLAASYWDVDREQEALAATKTVYEGMCKNLGQEHVSTLAAQNNLAVAYGKQEDPDYARGLEIHQQVYRARRRILGEKHPDTLNSMREMAWFHLRLGNHQQAMEMATQAHLLLQEVMGEQSMAAVDAQNVLTQIYNATQAYAQAIESAKKVYALRSRALGQNHPETLSALKQLAIVQIKGADIDTVAETLENLYFALRRRHQLPHPDVQSVLEMLYDCRAKLKCKDPVVRCIQSDYEWKCQCLGEDHEQTLEAMEKWASCCGHAGDLRQAIAILEQLHIFKCKLYGWDHEQAREALNLLLEANRLRHRLRKALRFTEAGYAIWGLFRSADDPRRLERVEELAQKFDIIGANKEALRWHETLLQLRCKHLGEDHPDSIRTKQRIGQLQVLLEEEE